MERYVYFFFLCWISVSVVSGKPLIPESRPNIILIMSDDQGWGDAGYQGHPHLKTPHLDKMAAEGLQFNRFYSAAPVCSPTRGSVITGRHPFRYGIYYANVGHMPDNELTVAEILTDQGYRTGHFGKWHLGTLTKTKRESNRGGPQNTEHYSPPWENGYQQTFATESRVPTWDPMVNPDPSVGGADRSRQEGEHFGTYYWLGPDSVADENLSGDDSRVIMDRVIPFIEKSVKKQKPFFTTIWFHTPHSPVVAGEKYREMYNRLSENEQHYYGCLTAMDEQIGRLRDYLKQAGVDKNTMIWFCSDNGPAARGGGPGLEAGERQQGSTSGLRGRKGTLYEGGIRVPGILVWPEVVKEHRVSDMPAVTSDYFPTILDILNIKLDKEPEFDGTSLKNLIFKTEEKRNSPIGFQSQFKGKMFQVWMDDRFKLVHTVEDKHYELYDIQSDPFEKNNLYLQETAVAGELKKQLKRWVEELE